MKIEFYNHETAKDAKGKPVVYFRHEQSGVNVPATDGHKAQYPRQWNSYLNPAPDLVAENAVLKTENVALKAEIRSLQESTRSKKDASEAKAEKRGPGRPRKEEVHADGQ